MAFRPDVFERDNHRCVYCCRDLLHDFDAFMLTHMDHLMPGAINEPENIVTACYVCNLLKSDFCPEGSTKKERIASARLCIMERRVKKILEDFSSWFD